MAGKILRDWEIEKAIRECLKDSESYPSLGALCRDVSEKLSPRGTTPGRIKRVGIEGNLFTFDITYSRTDRYTERERCPVCGGKLKTAYNRLIDGDGVTAAGYGCPKCGYSVKSAYMRPSRYIVRRKRNGQNRVTGKSGGASRGGRGSHRFGSAYVRHGVPRRKRLRDHQRDSVLRN